MSGDIFGGFIIGATLTPIIVFGILIVAYIVDIYTEVAIFVAFILVLVLTIILRKNVKRKREKEKERNVDLSLMTERRNSSLRVMSERKNIK